QFNNPDMLKNNLDRASKDIDKAKDIPADQKAGIKDFFKDLDKFARIVDTKFMKENGTVQGPRLKMEPVTGDQAHPLSPFEVTFPSAVLWGIIGCVTTFAISLVIERMQGTFLRLQVAPASWGQLLAGKGLACLLACCGVAVVLLLIGRLVFG